MSTLPQFEIKAGTVNVPDGLRTNDKTLLNQVCQGLYRAPPTFTTEYICVVKLPDGRAFSATSNVHSDAQLKAARKALNSITQTVSS